MITSQKSSGSRVSGAQPSLMDARIRDRARGALLGLSVGDALGTTLEFTCRDEHPRHTEMVGGGPFHLASGQWTDDTSMALALGESLLACRGLQPSDLMSRFLAWMQDGRYSCTGECFDIGITTAQALRRFSRSGEPYAGSLSENDAGNGSIMRLAPVPIFALKHSWLVAQMSRDQGRTTHGAPQAVGACELLSEMVRLAILGEPREKVLAPREWPGHPAVRALAAGGWRGKTRDKISASGYVIHTMEAALWCIEHATSFEDALVMAVNLGEDADTVGAVTGQLAGALYGLSSIPERWLKPLAWRSELQNLADQLLDADGGAVADIAKVLLRHYPAPIGLEKEDRDLHAASRIWFQITQCKEAAEVGGAMRQIFKQLRWQDYLATDPRSHNSFIAELWSIKLSTEQG